jgi:hypothetical protein
MLSGNFVGMLGDMDILCFCLVSLFLDVSIKLVWSIHPCTSSQLYIYFHKYVFLVAATITAKKRNDKCKEETQLDGISIFAAMHGLAVAFMGPTCKDMLPVCICMWCGL